MTTPKRPRDTNRLAKMVVDIVTGGEHAEASVSMTVKGLELAARRAALQVQEF